MSDTPIDWASWADVSQRLPLYTPLTAKEAIELTVGIECGPGNVDNIPLDQLYATLVVLFDPQAKPGSKGRAVNTIIDLARSSSRRDDEELDDSTLERLAMMFVREMAACRDDDEAAKVFGALLPDPGRLQAVVDYAEQMAQEDGGPLGAVYRRSAKALRGLLDSGASSPAPSTDER